MRFKKWLLDEATVTAGAEVGPDAIAVDDRKKKKKKKKLKHLYRRNPKNETE